MNIRRFCKELFCYSYWVIGIRKIADDSPLYCDETGTGCFHLVTDEPLVTVADPYLVENEGKLWLFYERQDLRTKEKRGDLRAVEVDSLGQVLNSRNMIVCSEDFHLSYPQVIEYEGEKYLIPESGHGNGIRLYKCVQFPDKWEYVKDILQGRFVDTNLASNSFEARGYSPEKSFQKKEPILFFTYKDKRLEVYQTSGLDEKPELIYRSEPSKKLRGAGYLFKTEEGGLIRPCQDCSERYGGAIEFRQLTVGEDRYEEKNRYEGKVVSRVGTEKIAFYGNPFKPWQIGGIHTYNQMVGFEVIDVLVYVFSPMAVVKNASRALRKRLKRV